MDKDRKTAVACMARDAGLLAFGGCIEERIERFAALVRAAALEEAAKVCAQQAGEPECHERAAYCADAIRKLIQS